jgi:UDP-N-acetylmuramoylalanine--D-glutamate ligase
MTPVTSFAGRRIALFGLGGSGLVTALALKAGGAQVLACDDNPAKVQEAGARGIETGDLRAADWSGFDALLLSPGVPLTHPEPHWSAKLAQGAGVEVIGDIELFCRERAAIAPDAPLVAITGTNGKSTTTALVAHILRETGHDVQMGGNIGTAILSLDPPGPARVHVVECSSFQIDLAPSLNASVGLHLNLSPDHLDRHGTIEDYAAIKERLIANADVAIVGVDDEASAAMVQRRVAAGRKTVRISAEHAVSEGFMREGSAIVRVDETGTKDRVADLAGIGSLRGTHNAQNAAAAIAAVTALGVPVARIQEAVRSFPGLAHRMEEVGRIGTALFVNDSKATNADSTEKALGSFRRIFWILGGKAKEGGITTLASYFPRIEKAYLIGAASDEFAGTLEGQVPFARCETLDRAVRQAAADAAAAGGEDAVVLLSPACASYDQYPNFERRGDHFRDLVRALPGIELNKGA